MRFIVPGDAEWPAELGALRNAGALYERGGEPVGLWVRGPHDLRQARRQLGGRRRLPGRHQLRHRAGHRVGCDLASMGHTVISGLAYGVDYAAHRGALSAGGPTVAVLPGGVDRPYPVAHAQPARGDRREWPGRLGGTSGRWTHADPLPGQEQGRRRPRRGHRGRRGSHAQRDAQHRPLDQQPAPTPHGRPRPGQQCRLHRRQPA
ncbi:hypothetical protein G5V59_19215 [Nocardioides sp. W3-2-3]|nr:hypothetical protein [Nocardioides convexus]